MMQALEALITCLVSLEMVQGKAPCDLLYLSEGSSSSVPSQGPQTLDRS
jgi:hypothetical protein